MQPNVNHRRLRSSLCVLGASALFCLGAACVVDGGGDVERIGEQRSVHIVGGGSHCVSLMAGQTMHAGTVCVDVDHTVDTSSECGAGATGVAWVTYTAVSEWSILSAHLAVGDEPTDIPTNNAGNPKVGHFAYADDDLGGVSSHTFTVPLCELGLDGSDSDCEHATAYLAAHAVVHKHDCEGDETAWGKGERINPQGSWAQYFTVELECSEQ